MTIFLHKISHILLFKFFLKIRKTLEKFKKGIDKINICCYNKNGLSKMNIFKNRIYIWFCNYVIHPKTVMRFSAAKTV